MSHLNHDPSCPRVARRTTALLALSLDGKLDLATENSATGGKVGRLLGNGNGTFAPQVTYPAGIQLTNLVTGDVNGDGKADLVVANYAGILAGGAAQVLLGDGLGGFGAPLNNDIGSGAWGLAIADINLDGRPDLVVGAGGGQELDVLPALGNGLFAPYVASPLANGSAGLIATDLNADGKPDVVVTIATIPGANTITVFVGTGTATPAPGQDIVVGLGPSAIAARDLNGDGKPDLVVPLNVAGSIAILINNSP